MKKPIPLFLALLLALNLCACSQKSEVDSNGQQSVEAPKETKSGGLTVEALESGLAGLFDDSFEHLDLKESDGGFTFSREEDFYTCSGKADKDKNISEVTVKAGPVDCELLADKSKLGEIIVKMTSGQSLELTMKEYKAAQAYNAVMQLYIALGADTSGSAAEFMAETVAVLTDGSSLSVNGWTISAALDAEAGMATVTAIPEN